MLIGFRYRNSRFHLPGPLWAALCFLVYMMAGVAHAGVSPDQIRDALSDTGYKVGLLQNYSSSDDFLLTAEREGEELEIRLRQCGSSFYPDTDCAKLYFSQSFPDLERDLEQINTFNSERVLGRAYNGDNGAIVEWGLHLGALDVDSTFVSEMLELWHEIVDNFEGASGNAADNAETSADATFHSSILFCPDPWEEFVTESYLDPPEGEEVTKGSFLYEHGASRFWTLEAEGGFANLEKCNLFDDPRGYIEQNYFLIEIEMDGAYDLEVRTDSECDTVLVVLDADTEWHFDDDSGPEEELVRIANAPSGSYRIWIGVLEPGSCESKLYIETFSAEQSDSSTETSDANADDGSCPDYEIGAQTRLTSIDDDDVVTGSDLYEFGGDRPWELEASGSRSLERCGHFDDASGLFADDHFTIETESECDTVLVVNDPNEKWHFDDDSGSDEELIKIANAPSGVYDIWIGVYEAGSCDTKLFFETF